MTNAPLSSPTPASEFSMEQWQHRFVLGILRIASVLGLLSMISVFNPGTAFILRVFYLIVYAILLITAFAPVPYAWRAGFIIFSAYVLGVSEILAGGLAGAARLYLLSMVILVNLLFSYRASLIALTVSIMTYIVGGVVILANLYHPISPVAITGTIFDWLTGGTTFIFITATINAAIHMLQSEFRIAYERGREMLDELRINQRGLEERVAERTASLERRTAELSAASEVARSIASINDIGSLLPTIVNDIAEKYRYHHVGIYMLDESGETGFLQASSSDEGRRMIESGYQISLSGAGIVEKCAVQRRVQVAQEISGESTDPHFPLTQSRAAFPLLAREREIGVLDVQSQQPRTFQPSEIESLQILADQLSLAIENSRLFEDMQSVIEQLQQTAEVRTQIAWTSRAGRSATAYQYTPQSVQKLASAPDTTGSSGTFSVPILLRGQSIGQIHLKRGASNVAWLEKEQAMVQEVASQIGLALENARLLEEAQMRVARERSLSEIASRISAAVDVEAILRTTVQEIGKALGDSEVTVQLHPESMDA